MKTKSLFLIAVVLCTLLASNLLGQCVDSQTFCDTGCNSDVSCPPTTTSGLAGCTSTNFTPACTGNYYLDVWTDCAGDFNCDHCRACALVYSGTTLIASCRNVGCVEGEGNCCENCGTVALVAHQTYVVKVCLSYCSGLDPNCTFCTEGNCQGCACLRYAIVSSCCVDEG